MDGHFFPGAPQQQFIATPLNPQASQQQQQQAQFPPQFHQFGYVPQPQPFQFIPAPPAPAPPPPGPAFFNSWEPPPIPVPPPADPELHKRIDKLAEYSAKNGPNFEAMIRDKQRDEPAYSFLFGAEGHAYYKYKLWITLNPHLVHFNPAVNLVSPALGIPAGLAPPAPQLQVQAGIQPGNPFPGFFDPGMISNSQQQIFEPAPALIITSVPVEMAAELRNLLESLTGAKDSIQSARMWFMQRSAFASLLADALRERVMSSNNVETQLHVFYLINDILLNSLQLRINVKELDIQALAFRPVLAQVLGAIHRNSNLSDPDRDQVEKMLQLWGAKEVFDPETLKSLGKEIKPADANPPTAHKQWQKEQPEQKGGDPAGASNSSSSSAAAASSSSVAALFPALAPFLSQQQQQQQASTPPYPHFPPGLIPGMVRKMQIGSGVPYSSLSPLDIPAIIPTGASSETHILDRVSKFFREIGEKDPLAGSFPVSDDEEEDREEERGRGARIPPPPQMQTDSETGTLPDGSLGRRPGMISSGRLGLGASADPNEATPYDDVYTSYRKQRSTNYHSSMSARAAAAR